MLCNEATSSPDFETDSCVERKQQKVVYASSDSSPDFETNSCVERLKKKPKLEDSMPVCTLEEESAELTSFKAPRMLFTPFPSTLNSKSFHQTSNDREGGIIVNVTHKTQKDSSDIVKTDST